MKPKPPAMTASTNSPMSRYRALISMSLQGLAIDLEERRAAGGDYRPARENTIGFEHFLAKPHMPIEEKKMAKRPSTTITRKIDFTTDVVVCSPRDSALPWTRMPSAQATTPIIRAMNGAL